MNESASSETPFLGTQLSRCECMYCLCKAGSARQAEQSSSTRQAVQSRQCKAGKGVATPAQCGAGDLGETSSLGGPWVCGLGTQPGPKYSRTITTPARAPGSQEVDFLSPNFAEFPRPAIVCPSFPAGRWVLKTRCAAYPGHNNCQFEALENQAIRTQCAAASI